MGDCWLSILVRTCVSDTSLYPFVETFFFFVCLFLREVAIAFSGAERGLHGNSVDRLFKVGDV